MPTTINTSNYHYVLYTYYTIHTSHYTLHITSQTFHTIHIGNVMCLHCDTIILLLYCCLCSKHFSCNKYVICPLSIFCAMTRGTVKTFYINNCTSVQLSYSTIGTGKVWNNSSPEQPANRN